MASAKYAISAPLRSFGPVLSVEAEGATRQLSPALALPRPFHAQHRPSRQRTSGAFCGRGKHEARYALPYLRFMCRSPRSRLRTLPQVLSGMRARARLPPLPGLFCTLPRSSLPPDPPLAGGPRQRFRRTPAQPHDSGLPPPAPPPQALLRVWKGMHNVAGPRASPHLTMLSGAMPMHRPCERLPSRRSPKNERGWRAGARRPLRSPVAMPSSSPLPCHCTTRQQGADIPSQAGRDMPQLDRPGTTVGEAAMSNLHQHVPAAVLSSAPRASQDARRIPRRRLDMRDDVALRPGEAGTRALVKRREDRIRRLSR